MMITESDTLFDVAIDKEFKRQLQKVTLYLMYSGGGSSSIADLLRGVT